MTPPTSISPKSDHLADRTLGGLVVIGPAGTLDAAWEIGEPVTLTVEQLAGEQVHLGERRRVRRDDSITVERTGRLGSMDVGADEPYAIYAVDTDRLDAAPAVAEIANRIRLRRQDTAAGAEDRADAEERRLETAEEDR